MLITELEYDVSLIDDGTLDTVIEVMHPDWDEPREYRYACEFAAEYRDEDSCLDLDLFATEVVIPDAENGAW